MPKRKRVNWRNNLGWLGLAIAVPSLLFGFWTNWQKGIEGKTYSVIDVIDGDTLVTEEKQKIRLANLEAPELDLCGGQEAKELLQSLVLNREITVQVQGVDVYGRPLAYVYVDGQLANQVMVASGWSQYKGGGGSGENREILKAESNQAREEKRGIYSDKCVQTENPDDPKCLIKGNHSQNGLRSKIYHFPGCSRYEDVTVDLYRGEQWFCSEKEAEAAGFTKSKNCFGKKFEK